jgi:hypothetical protein
MNTKSNASVEYALKTFPDFVTSSEYDANNKELPYLLYADLTSFFKKILETKDEVKIKLVFDFINSFFDSGKMNNLDKELVSVEVFEEFASYPETTTLAREFLNPLARESFERVFNDYGYNRKLKE